jgi:cell division protease FtsH
MASEIDEEIRNIIQEAYATAEKLLTEKMEILHTVANALLEIETLDGEQFEMLFTGQMTAQELAEDVREKEEQIRKSNALEAAETEDILSREEVLEYEDLSEDEPEDSEESEELTDQEDPETPENSQEEEEDK